MKYKIPEKLSILEFILLMASLVALGAMSTDAMLPAMMQIGTDLHVKQANDIQLIVTSIFAGLAIGQLFYGPLSDSLGRKSSIYIALGVFILGSLIALFSSNFYVLLFGRFLQGLGVAGTKIVTMALIRDLYKGNAMAQIMSFIGVTFILAPTLAPTIGGAILRFSDWKSIFLLFVVVGVLSFLWFAFRQKETLKKENQIPFNFENIKKDILEVLKNKIVMSYTLILGLIFGVFMAYLSMAEQIFVGQYKLGEKFPLYFALNALASGTASILNAKYVKRFGMDYISIRAIGMFSIISLIFLPICYMYDGNPPLYMFMIFCMSSFFCTSLLNGNLNALAMEPMGHIAGMAATVVGSLSTFISLIIGVTIGRLYDGNLLPITTGFLIVGVMGMILFVKTRKKLKTEF